ncbi:hypothetical protein G7Y89_g8817 [Cudoniella acicularis]|uniref:Uncharacterized protein n=1 Tax=Cudoniella acicularis TaxID=354080 RepID=A0A8H4RIH8_9HELO|nr:hypothetical protein G7Y89_g8817 [Cudoniella acicularis]
MEEKQELIASNTNRCGNLAADMAIMDDNRRSTVLSNCLKNGTNDNSTTGKRPCYPRARALKAEIHIASRFLLARFVFRPDRKEMENFARAMKDTNMALGVRLIRFETGTMDIFWILHDAKQNYRDLAALKYGFSKFKRLKAIEISGKDCPFKNTFLQTSWMSSSQNSNYKRIIKEFVTILLALQTTSSQVKYLSHDKIPTAFFALSPVFLRNLTKPLTNLQSLCLTLDATTTPHLKSWDGLGVVLKLCPLLRHLRFGYAPLEDGCTNQGT